MKNKPVHLWIDQYGHKVYARDRAELMRVVGSTHASKIYRDKKDGRTVHVGYVVAGRWFDRYAPVEVEA